VDARRALVVRAGDAEPQHERDAVKEFEGRVAVVTGAASGIGFALAKRFGAERMKVVLADVEPAALEGAARELEKQGVECLPVTTDVTSGDDVRRLAERSVDAFGAVHVVCNNAGIFGTGGPSWQVSVEDYEWTLGVNCWGVIHGIRTFVPLLLAHGESGHVVNTASMAAVTSFPFAGAYVMSKHAVLALSECLYHELAARGAPVGVSALCPEGVATRIDRAERNRPPHLKAPEDSSGPEAELVQAGIADTVRTGTPPDEIAERTFQAVRENRFYVLSEDAWRRSAEARLEDVRLARNPTFSPPVG
jgi:NAD(P)-dependent dehydrogenase (short-subunit alcohol dehydrogenase family)